MVEKEIPISSAFVEDDGDCFFLIHNIYKWNYFAYTISILAIRS